MSLTFVDSHAHLDMEEFDEDRDQVIERAFKEGVKAILCPTDLTDQKGVKTTLCLIENHRTIIAAAGVHPHQAKAFKLDDIRKIEELARTEKIKAVGEIGLDFFYNHSPSHKQEEVFRHQLHTAQSLGLPVVVHSRNSSHKTAQAVEEEHYTGGGVLHCFTEDWELAKRLIDRNFFISFSGIITFPKAQSLREIAQKVPLEKILIETDSPFLAPAPLRKKMKRNEPAFMIETARILAEIKKVSLSKIAEVTTRNFEYLFQFEIQKI